MRLLLPVLPLLLFGCGHNVTAQDHAIGERALEEAKALVAAHPSRDAGMTSREVAGWIARRLPEQNTQILPFGTSRGKMANVLHTGVVKPVAVLASHFDTKPGIPGFIGANDGASTTGLLIALAKTRTLPVLYLFLDGEECAERYSADDGLHGSWYAARSRVGGDLPVIVLDMLGDADFTPGLAANGSPWLNGILRRAAKDVGLELGDAGVIVDDHVPFVAAGRRAADIIDFEYGPDNAWWHTAEDTTERLSASSLAKAVALVRRTVELLEKERK